MILHRIEDMIGGWYIGDFIPSAYQTNNFEVSFKVHPKNQIWDTHYHEKITEINLLVSGRMVLQGKELVKGDIFILNPYEVADPNFLEDCEIVCVKIPGIKNDKIIMNLK